MKKIILLFTVLVILSVQPLKPLNPRLNVIFTKINVVTGDTTWSDIYNNQTYFTGDFTYALRLDSIGTDSTNCKLVMRFYQNYPSNNTLVRMLDSVRKSGDYDTINVIDVSESNVIVYPTALFQWGLVGLEHLDSLRGYLHIWSQGKE